MHPAPRDKDRGRSWGTSEPTHTHVFAHTHTRDGTGSGKGPGERDSSLDLLLFSPGSNSSVPRFPRIKKRGAPALTGSLNMPLTARRGGEVILPGGQPRGALPRSSGRSPVMDQSRASSPNFIFWTHLVCAWEHLLQGFHHAQLWPPKLALQ